MTRWEEVLAMLGDLTRWVEEVSEETDNLGSTEGAGGSTDEAWSDRAAASELPGERFPDVCLSVLLAELTALRHEVKLQTRSAHQDRELAGQSLASLARAVENLDHLRQEEDARLAAAVARREAPWVELLVDLHDALSRSVSRADEQLVRMQALAREPLAPPAPRKRLLPWRRRKPADHPAARVGERMPDLLHCVEGLVEGLRLGAARIERALRGVGVEPVEAKGQLVDPEWMEVVEIARDETLPPDLVIDEARRGYRKDGRVYRWAQVVANRLHPDAHERADGSVQDGAAQQREEGEVDAWT